MFKTIRLQLLSIILVFALLTTVSTVVIFTYFMNSRDTVLGISQKTKTAYILLLEDVKVMHDFFENETINPQFFETGKSKLLSRHQRICRQIDQAISGLEAGAYENKDLLAQIRTFKDDFEIYKRNATSIISNILKRGFKDYGLEGDMRKFAHELEDFKNEIGLVNILQMRRHEKDFITRQEDEYIKKHEALVAKISKGLAERGNHNQRSEKALLSLQNYADRLKKLTSY
jgi:adenylate cyclase